jgi:hypothetical protein
MRTIDDSDEAVERAAEVLRRWHPKAKNCNFEDVARSVAKAMQPISEHRCGDCRFWLYIERGNHGEDEGCCHRYPPVFNPAGVSTWPGTMESDTCGEHQPRE